MIGAFGLSSNVLSAGVGYSQFGGFSANAFGFSVSSSGVIFDPSISASYTFNVEINSKQKLIQQAAQQAESERLRAMLQKWNEEIEATLQDPGFANPNSGSELYQDFVVLENVVILGSYNIEVIWMKIAKGELGVVEATGNNDGPDVAKYLRTVGLGTGKYSYWCAAFVNWTMKEAGIPVIGIRPAWALDWRKFGTPLSKPAYGAVATKARNGGGHVGFVAGITSDGKIVLLGGNQGNMVKYESFNSSQLKYNFPIGYTPNYNLPIMTNININYNMK